MKYSDYIERRKHGRTAFPLESYHLDADHPRYVMPLHWHPEMEIVRVREGLFDLHLNRNSYRLSGGDVAIIARERCTAASRMTVATIAPSSTRICFVPIHRASSASIYTLS